MAVRRHTRRQVARRACQRCGKAIPLVARKHRDPFCSRVCAEATYGPHTRSTPGRMVIGGLRLRLGIERGPSPARQAPWKTRKAF